MGKVDKIKNFFKQLRADSTSSDEKQAVWIDTGIGKGLKRFEIAEGWFVSDNIELKSTGGRIFKADISDFADFESDRECEGLDQAAHRVTLYWGYPSDKMGLSEEKENSEKPTVEQALNWVRQSELTLNLGMVHRTIKNFEILKENGVWVLKGTLPAASLGFRSGTRTIPEKTQTWVINTEDLLKTYERYQNDEERHWHIFEFLVYDTATFDPNRQYNPYNRVRLHFPREIRENLSLVDICLK